MSCVELLALTAHRDAVDVDRYRHHEPRSARLVARGTSVDHGRVIQHDPRLDTLPLGAPVLEPDLYLQRKLTSKLLTNNRNHT